MQRTLGFRGSGLRMENSIPTLPYSFDVIGSQEFYPKRGEPRCLTNSTGSGSARRRSFDRITLNFSVVKGLIRLVKPIAGLLC